MPIDFLRDGRLIVAMPITFYKSATQLEDDADRGPSPAAPADD